jgi:phosphoribosyl 1,2-cyclic phosphodiesterase
MYWGCRGNLIFTKCLCSSCQKHSVEKRQPLQQMFLGKLHAENW